MGLKVQRPHCQLLRTHFYQANSSQLSKTVAVPFLFGTFPPFLGPMARTLTAYSYTNYGLPEHRRHRCGTLWTDSEYDSTMWQTVDHVTPWHGSFFATPTGFTVSFDCYVGQRREFPYLKIHVMWTTLAGSYVGYDYRGRCIHMVPLSQFVHVEGPDNGGNGTWELTYTWADDGGCWRRVPIAVPTLADAGDAATWNVL